MRGMSIVIATAYFKDTIDITGENLDLAASINQLRTDGVADAMILMADFNVTPTQRLRTA